jgi:hypothetical protein
MSDEWKVLVVIAVVAVIAAVAWQGRQSGVGSKIAVPFAKIIDEADGSAAAGLGGLMLAIFSLISFMQFATATTVLQEIAALLIWIGSNTLCGIFIIGGLLARRQTHVYSDLLTNLEKNIARLEKMQEQTSSATAVADAISPLHDGPDTHTVTTPVDEAERFPRQDPRPWRGA